MHTTEVGSNNVPAFLTKLWKLVEDSSCDDLICWSPNGRSFIIHNQTQFAKDLLPQYFKHNNMASFIRQLNMYGFRKVAHIEQGGLRSERDDIEFYHNFFVRGQECLLEFIKRKIPTGRNGDDAKVHPNLVRDLLKDMSSIQGKQENVDMLLQDIKKENEALWREVAMLRQKHLKQQQIVDKLIQFLVTLVQANRNITVKRKMPLMIHDNPSNAKIPRLTGVERKSTDYQVSSPASHTSEGGPVIHDVTDLIEDLIDTEKVPHDTPTMATEIETSIIPEVSSPSNSTESIEPLPILETLGANCGTSSIIPEEEIDALNKEETDKFLEPAALLSDKSIPILQDSIGLANVPDFETVTTSEANRNDREEDMKNNRKEINSPEMRVAIHDSRNCDTRAVLHLTEPQRLPIKSSLIEHVDGVETELDWLQEQLANGGLNIDSSTLLGVCSEWKSFLGLGPDMQIFGSDDSLLNNLPGTSKHPSDSIIGNELVQYAPSLLDLQMDEDDTSNNFFSVEPSTSEGTLETLFPGTSSLETPKEFDGIIPKALNTSVKKGRKKRVQSSVGHKL